MTKQLRYWILDFLFRFPCMLCVGFLIFCNFCALIIPWSIFVWWLWQPSPKLVFGGKRSGVQTVHPSKSNRSHVYIASTFCSMIKNIFWMEVKLEPTSAKRWWNTHSATVIRMAGCWRLWEQEIRIFRSGNLRQGLLSLCLSLASVNNTRTCCLMIL